MKGIYVDVTAKEKKWIIVYCGCGEELDVNDASEEKAEVQVFVHPHKCKEAQQ